MEKSNKEVIKDIPTVLPVGMRIGESDGLFVLEFLDLSSKKDYKVLSSTALTKDMQEQLMKHLENHKKNTDKNGESDE